MSKKIPFALAAIVLLLLGAWMGYRMVCPPAYHPAEDELTLFIQLDTQEEIGLLVIDYNANGHCGSGGVSNADKSLMKKDELIIYTLTKQELGVPSHEIGDLSLQFTVITEYCDPNYENRYPSVYTKPAGTLAFTAKLGEAYLITICGNQSNGYTASLTSAP